MIPGFTGVCRAVYKSFYCHAESFCLLLLPLRAGDSREGNSKPNSSVLMLLQEIAGLKTCLSSLTASVQVTPQRTSLRSVPMPGLLCQQIRPQPLDYIRNPIPNQRGNSILSSTAWTSLLRNCVSNGLRRRTPLFSG